MHTECVAELLEGYDGDDESEPGSTPSLCPPVISPPPIAKPCLRPPPIDLLPLRAQHMRVKEEAGSIPGTKLSRKAVISQDQAHIVIPDVNAHVLYFVCDTAARHALSMIMTM